MLQMTTQLAMLVFIFSIRRFYILPHDGSVSLSFDLFEPIFSVKQLSRVGP